MLRSTVHMVTKPWKAYSYIPKLWHSLPLGQGFKALGWGPNGYTLKIHLTFWNWIFTVLCIVKKYHVLGYKKHVVVYQNCDIPYPWARGSDIRVGGIQMDKYSENAFNLSKLLSLLLLLWTVNTLCMHCYEKHVVLYLTCKIPYPLYCQGFRF